MSGLHYRAGEPVYAWLIPSRPGWMKFGAVEVEVVDMDDWDIAGVCEQLTAEALSLT